MLFGCSDAENERSLVNLHTAAAQDVISISFPDSAPTTVSINAEVDFTLQALTSRSPNNVTVSQNVKWSLSADANSSIDQSGHFTAASSAENITLTAELGFYSTSMDIRVSAARFDQVIKLDAENIEIKMCQSRVITPVGRYVDDEGIEETRPVDSTVLDSIEWLIRDQEDDSSSIRAYIESVNNQVILHALDAGDILVQAKAVSVLTGNPVTSSDISQSILNQLNSIKLCLSNAQDLANCSLIDPEIEKDKILSVVAIGQYQNQDGSSIYQNITHNSKWGASDHSNISRAFSSDRQKLNVTGLVEVSSSTLSAACGNIEQTLDAIDISQGIMLDSLLSCADNTDCLEASSFLSINQLSVSSMSVSANGLALISDESTTLTTRPDEISLVVKVVYSNTSEATITEAGTTLYTIFPVDGQADAIEKKAGTKAVFTVLGAGTAIVQVNYRNAVFNVEIVIP